MATLIRIDRNGTKYFSEDRCPKCNGSGTITWSNLDAGRCWLCGGSGKHTHSWKEYTPEYAKKLAERRLEKVRKAAPEQNRKFRQSIGLNDDGSAWIVINEYAKSADMKPLGARWTPRLGWFFKEEHDGTFYMSGDDLGEYQINGLWSFKPDIEKVIAEKRTALLPKSNSEYIGNVGEKLDTVAVFDHEARFETHFTYYGETVCILTFKAGDNTIVWKTSSYNALEKGKKYRVRGTVKEHSEYRGDKQTVLTRCKIEEIKEEENGEN